MRRLAQPGPAAAERIESHAGRGRVIEFALGPGLTLNAALTGPLVAAGMQSAAVVFSGAALAPFRYVMPGPPVDEAHVAWYSAASAPAGPCRVELANATFGWRDGVPFVHCHGAWVEPDGARRGGHMLPDETIIQAGAPVRAWATEDVTIATAADPETNFTLFHPTASGPAAQAPGMVVARIHPNEDIHAAIEALCRRHGLVRAAVRGSLGSLIGARFTDGREVPDHATEVLVRRGDVAPDAAGAPRAELDMLVIDMQGRVHEGTLRCGENAVCISFELFLEAV